MGRNQIEGAPEDARRALSSALTRVADEVPLGLAVLDADGNVTLTNSAARQVLDGSAAGPVQEVLGRMCERAGRSGEPVETVLSLGPAGEVHLLLSPGDAPSTFVAFIERSGLSRMRAETRTLREMLASAAAAEPPREVIGRTLDILAGSLPGCTLALYERREDVLVAFGRAGAPFHREHLPEHQPLGERSSGLVRAALSAAPVHLPRLGPGRSAAVDDDDPRALLSLPVRTRGAVGGVLAVVGPTDTLGEGELRLLQGLADTVGVLLHRAQQEARLAEAAAAERRLRAEVAEAREVAASREPLAIIGRLAAGVAHEINNPVAYLKSNLTTMVEFVDELETWVEGAREAGAVPDAPPPTEAIEELRSIAHDAEDGLARIANIVAALKGSAHTSGRAISFDPGRSVRDAVTIFRGAKRTRCEIALELPPLPQLVGPPNAVSQIVLNLLENAFHATGGGGRIEVTGRLLPGAVQIEVADDGSGIPDEVAEHVFEPFFTTKGPGDGTGLGLYLCRDLAGHLGGSLGFRTGAEGTTFVLTLPTDPEPIDADGAKGGLGNPHLRSAATQGPLSTRPDHG